MIHFSDRAPHGHRPPPRVEHEVGRGKVDTETLVKLPGGLVARRVQPPSPAAEIAGIVDRSAGRLFEAPDHYRPAPGTGRTPALKGAE